MPRLPSLLNASPELRQIVQRAQLATTLQRHYAEIAPPSLRQASHVMRLEGSTLVLAAYNSAVAAKLRQLTGELISSFLTRGCEVTGIQIRVQAQRGAAPAPSVQYRHLGKTGKKTLDDFSARLEEGPLKNTLQRLAAKARG
ncbi:MAG: hypothetical protein Fur0040_01110 [Sideroxydans sp.]